MSKLLEALIKEYGSPHKSSCPYPPMIGPCNCDQEVGATQVWCKCVHGEVYCSTLFLCEAPDHDNHAHVCEECQIGHV